MSTLTYQLDLYGARASGTWYAKNPTFTDAISEKYIGLGISDSTYYNYGVFLYKDLSFLSGTSISSITLTVNCNSNEYNKDVAVGKKTNSSTTDYAYTYLQMTGVVARAATSFTVDLTSQGLCPYGYVLWQNDQNSTYAVNPIVVTSAILTIVVDDYTVSYNNNGHGTAPSSQTKVPGTDLTLRSFIGTNYSSNTTVTITGNANGGTWSGTNGNATWRYKYEQQYWNTKSDGTGTNYGSNDTYSSNASAILYAIWNTTQEGTSYTLPTGIPTKSSTTTNPLTVTFNANGGNTTKASEVSTQLVTYSFNGWWTASTGGVQRTTNSRVTQAETVYAQYTSSTGTQGAVTLPTISECTRTGYSLLGWSTSSTATTATYSPGASYTPDSSITLYAVWGALNTIRIVNNGNLDVYLIYVVENNALVPYRATVVNNGSLDTYI